MRCSGLILDEVEADVARECGLRDPRLTVMGGCPCPYPKDRYGNCCADEHKDAINNCIDPSERDEPDNDNTYLLDGSGFVIPDFGGTFDTSWGAPDIGDDNNDEDANNDWIWIVISVVVMLFLVIGAYAFIRSRKTENQNESKLAV